MANNFTADPNCKALWRFNSGALTTDSKSTNTLTNTGVAGDTTNHVEGSGCGDWESTESDYMSIADASLASGFPLKSGDTNKVISVCAWVRLESINTNGNRIFEKNNGGSANKRSFQAGIGSDSKVMLALGYNSGISVESVTHATVLSLATWYHITWTYNNADKSYQIMVRDESGGVVGIDLTGTATLDVNKLSVSDSILAIGAHFEAGVPVANYYHDGLIDELVVFNNIKTAAQATLIAKGRYGEYSGFCNPIYDADMDSMRGVL